MHGHLLTYFTTGYLGKLIPAWKRAPSGEIRDRSDYLQLVPVTPGIRQEAILHKNTLIVIYGVGKKACIGQNLQRSL
jgi:hypothetical protein